ncbi:MAG: hypothetical protein EOM22_05260 [Gammaproteobacteria bacterium]|nr:hypothetical protein [Gammaproteobacteria bacterium]
MNWLAIILGVPLLLAMLVAALGSGNVWIVAGVVGVMLLIVRGYIWGRAGPGPADKAGLALIALGFVAGVGLAIYRGRAELIIPGGFMFAGIGMGVGGYIAFFGSFVLWTGKRLSGRGS